jgi:hypothetical protein
MRDADPPVPPPGEPSMTDFDERALRSPRLASQSIGTGDLRPWMVWTAASAIAVLAVLGTYMGIRGAHPASDVTLTWAGGEPLNPNTAAAASPAAAMPKDEQWSTLSGPEVLAKSSAPTKASAADEADSDDADSSESAAAAATDDQPDVTPSPPPASSAAPNTPPATPGAQPAQPSTP